MRPGGCTAALCGPTANLEEMKMRFTECVYMRNGLALLILNFCFFQASHAQPYPVKPIEVVVHVNPGGGADIFGRYVANIINKEKYLPQQMVVVNKPGGAHAVAASYVAAKKGDPYTILTVAHNTFLAVPTISGLDVGLNKFTPLAFFGLDSQAVTVRADAPYKSMKDLTDVAKAKPKSITVGIGTIGSPAHMLGNLIEKQTGARFNYIGLKGGGESILGVLGGNYQLTFENISEIMDHVRAKKLRVISVSTESRLPFLPDVPTLKEQGLPVVVGLGRGFVAPAGIPKEAREALETAFEKVSRSAAWKDFAEKSVFTNRFMKGAEFGKFMKSELPPIVQFATELGLAKKK